MTRGSRSWDDAEIVAYLDGELPAPEAARIAMILRDDPEAAEIARLMQSGGQAARGAFTDALTAPLPPSLEALAAPRPAASAAPRRFDLLGRLGLVGWRGPAFAATVAAVALLAGLMVARSGDMPGGTLRPAAGSAPSIGDEVVGAELLAALDSGPDGSTTEAGHIRIIGAVDTGLPYRCRAFRIEGPGAADGIACKDSDGGWSVLTLPPNGATQP
ncbi:anti-sigma factor [Inquilinus sp. YAF38]|uniref:anti-sigma factor family protein n=1 Tax=Inquilinus sp. YAF38 TaxID=3233084 RepID=UPI003F93BBCE